MLIGVLSDTHDQIGRIKEVVAAFNHRGVELAVHCGDIVSPFTLPYFAELHCPLKAVFGNNDGDRFRHALFLEKAKFNFEFEARFFSFSIDGRKVALFHGDYSEIVEALVTCQKWDAVFHGHTHTATNQSVGKTLSLNPGTLLDETSKTVKGASYAIYNSKTNQAEIIKLKEKL